MSGALLYLGVLMVTFLLGIPVALGLGGTSIILTLLERGVEVQCLFSCPAGNLRFE